MINKLSWTILTIVGLALINACAIVPQNSNDPETWAYPWVKKAVLHQRNVAGVEQKSYEAVIDNGTAGFLGVINYGTLTFTVDPGTDVKNCVIDFHGVFSSRFNNSHEGASDIVYDSDGFIFLSDSSQLDFSTQSSEWTSFPYNAKYDLVRGGPMTKVLPFYVIIK